MIGWLQLTDDQRRTTLSQAASQSGIQAKAIEKDWWVTLTLKALFTSVYAPHMVFKGGTSLSKCWHLIHRFSEDIDIGLDPAAFNMEYVEVPTKSYVKKLKREGCKFTSEQLRMALEEQMSALGLPSGTVTIEAAPVPADFPDTDPQTIYVRYPSLYPPLSYIADEVKIEVSVRSLLTPFTTMDVQSLLNEYFPNPVYGETPYSVTAVEPHKTLLEKIFLLHEEFQKPDRGRIRSERMSRHLYDLVSMMNTPAEARALEDYALYDHIIIHRKWYTAYTYLDYETLGHTFVQFVPADDLLEAYRRDYETMQEEMIYGDPPDFDSLLRGLKMLQGKLRVKMEGKSLEEIIEKARGHIPNALQLQQEATELQIPVTYVADPMHPISAANKTVTYTIHFRREHDGFKFEDIRF